MARSTAPILAIGGSALLLDNVLFGSDEIDFKMLAATGFAALAFAMLEKVNATLAVGTAWIALLTAIMLRKSPGGATLLDQLDYVLHVKWRGETRWTVYQP